MLLLARLLAVHRHNLDLVCRQRLGVVELEVDVFDDKRPYIVAEPVGVEMTLKHAG